MAKIRIAIPSDADSLTQLCAEHAAYELSDFDPLGHAEKLALLLQNGQLRIFIAEAKGAQIGFASVSLEVSTWRAAHYLHMDCLFVSQEYRGNSIGTKLLGAVAKYASETGIDEVQWQTPDWNVDAIRFYERAGGTAKHKVRFYLAPAVPATKNPGLSAGV
jgi:GNAT superfamily N-acetyltransferase